MSWLIGYAKEGYSASPVS